MLRYIRFVQKKYNLNMKKCIISLFYILDNFCKIYEEWEQKKLVPTDRKRQREGSLKLCELLTIVLYFYLSPCKDFKNYYLYYLSYKYRGYFKLPSISLHNTTMAKVSTTACYNAEII